MKDTVKSYYLYYLSKRCQEETAKYRQGKSYDQKYCYELFAYALRDKHDLAWTLLYERYSGQAERWVQRHPLFAQCEEDIDQLVNAAFMRMQKAIPPEKFENFSTVQQLLRYLQTCIDGTIRDHLKKVRQEKNKVHLDDVAYELSDHGASGNVAMEEGLFQEDFWQCIQQQIRNEKERLFVLGCFVYGMKPRELSAQYQDFFPRPKDVNIVRNTFFGRLRKPQHMSAFLDCVGDEGAMSLLMN
ncbi:MAG: sigma-70 family RNA polymerase sigma factor [Chloroflexota bacterium]